jgi:hypothetical protein
LGILTSTNEEDAAIDRYDGNADWKWIAPRQLTASYAVTRPVVRLKAPSTVRAMCV